MVEVEVAQLLQGGMAPPDPVERGDQRGDGAALALGRLPVAGPQLVLLRVEVLLAALAQRGVLAQLVAAVDAPGGGEGRGEHGARPRRPGGRRAGGSSCRMSGVLTKKLGRM